MKQNAVKIICFALLFSVFLSGCTANRELDEQSLICTLCFYGEDEFTVTVEVITESNKEETLETLIHTSHGKTPKEAIKNLKNSMPKELMFDHCAAIVLDPDMSEERQKQVLLYCVDNPTINLDAQVVYCSDPQSLFECSPELAAIGYDISMILKQLSLQKNSRLYKTALTLKNIQTFKNDDGTLIRVEN